MPTVTFAKRNYRVRQFAKQTKVTLLVRTGRKHYREVISEDSDTLLSIPELLQRGRELAASYEANRRQNMKNYSQPGNR